MTTAPHLLITTDAVGGVWSYSVELAAGFARRGIRVTVVTLGPRPTAAQCAALHADLVQTDLPLDWTASSRAALDAAAAALAAAAHHAGADSVHLHTPALIGHAAWPCPVVAVAHSCVATWWRAVRGGALPADLAWRADAMAAGLARADAVVAPSRSFARMLLDAYPAVPRLHVVHNGRTPLAGRRTKAAAPPVFTAGRLWDEAKGAATLDVTARTLGTAIRAAGPVIGPNGAAFAAGTLRLLGPLDSAAMASEFAAAAAFASAACYEPFGLAVLEAAQAGLPLVLSDIATHRELWDGAARFVPCGDAAGFCLALREVLDDASLAETLAQAARARAADFSADATASRTLAIHAAIARGEWATAA
ncbi:MAG TPA: glycosyltransferase family 4 protein [Acetobacteraceae bacterium]|nr:glycosyltransferase family 4 protein [Acetobacteraceae bacterium]